MTNKLTKKRSTTITQDELILKRGIKHHPKKRRNKQTTEQKKISRYFSTLGKKSWQLRRSKILGL